MSEYVKVAVDAMGGDNAPVEIIKGAVEFVIGTATLIHSAVSIIL